MERVESRSIYLFVKSLNCGIGGMESHQRAFIQYFSAPSRRHTFYIVEKNNDKSRLYMIVKNNGIINLGEFSYTALLQIFLRLTGHKPVFFFNDFWWIEHMNAFRENFPKSKILIRSGGNDIELAPWNIGNLSYEERSQKCSTALNSADWVISNSDFTSKRLRNHGVKDEIILKLRGGVDTQKCHLVLRDKELLRQYVIDRFRIVKPYIFVFSCRMVPFKGILESLKALISSPMSQNVHLIFIGDGPLRRELEIFCKEKGLSSSFTGSLSNKEVLEIVGGCNALINPSLELLSEFKGNKYVHTETMGRSMMEAISVHTPILATNVGGTQELFDENDSIGILTDSQVPAEAFEEIIKDDFKFLIHKDYSWTHIFQEYIKLSTD